MLCEKNFCKHWGSPLTILVLHHSLLPQVGAKTVSSLALLGRVVWLPELSRSFTVQYVCAYVCAHRHTHIQTCISTYITPVYTYIPLSTCVQIYTVNTYMHTHILTHLHKCIHMHAEIHIHTDICTYTHVHKHTHTESRKEEETALRLEDLPSFNTWWINLLTSFQAPLTPEHLGSSLPSSGKEPLVQLLDALELYLRDVIVLVSLGCCVNTDRLQPAVEALIFSVSF